MNQNNTFFWLYNTHSAGGNALKEAMGLRQIRHEGSTFRASRDKVVINWGSGELPVRVHGCHIINDEAAVNRSINKLTSFRAFFGAVNTPDWTTSREEASKWLANGSRIVVRGRLEGREGAGLEIVNPAVRSNTGLLGAFLRTAQESLPPAPLYTKFIQAEREYRVHVVNGACVAVHRKVGGEGVVRNTPNGWVFRRVTQYPQEIVNSGIAAIRALGLDFGAVDILWDGTRSYVLETNTAPGIDGMEWTIARYANALENLVDSKLNAR